MGPLKTLKFKFRQLNRKRINGTRNLILNLVIFLFDSRRNQVKTSEDAPILVLRSDGKIGDSIVASGFFRELKRLSPKSKIIVIGNPQVLSVYKNSDYIDEIFVLKKGLVSTLKIFSQIRKTHFKFFLNSTDEVKPHAAFFQGQIKAGEKFIFCSTRLKSTTRVIDYEGGQTHFSYLYENTLKALSPRESFDVSYELKISPLVLKRVKDLLKDYVGEGRRIILLNSFAGTKLRSFSQETTLKIVELLLKDPNNMVISIGAPHDLRIIKLWMNKLPSNRWTSLDKLKTLEEAFAQIYFSDLLITPDTSLVHAACALKKKVVAVYRQRKEFKNSSVWGPRMKDKSNYRVIHAVSQDEKYWDVNLVKISDIEVAINEVLYSHEIEMSV